MGANIGVAHHSRSNGPDSAISPPAIAARVVRPACRYSTDLSPTLQAFRPCAWRRRAAVANQTLAQPPQRREPALFRHATNLVLGGLRRRSMRGAQ